MDCIFCKIIAKKMPGYFVMEENDYVAFLDIFGSAPGHSLVVPRRHGYSILDYTERELGRIMVGVQEVARKLKKALKTDSITIGINHEERRGVPHLHIHLIPRFEDDGGGIIQSVVKRRVKEDLPAGRQDFAKIAEKIRSA
ncbi:MAG: HIT family protein [Candidatus Levybacteria bacterium]|nr:HIT family protein [Candidatus Levybacteria bacterium]